MLRILLLVVAPAVVMVGVFAALWFGIRDGLSERGPVSHRPQWWASLTTMAGRALVNVPGAARPVVAGVVGEVRRVIRTGLGRAGVDEVTEELAAVRRLGTPGPDDDPALQTGAYPPAVVVGRAGVPPARPTTGEPPHRETAGVNPWFAARVEPSTGGRW